MERKISVEVTCKNCEEKTIGKFLLNTRTDKEENQRVNIPLGELNLSQDEVELVCDDTIVDDEINLHYNCKECDTKNYVTILITDEMKMIKK